MALKITLSRLDTDEKVSIVMQDFGLQETANTWLSVFEIPNVGRVESLFVADDLTIASGMTGMARLAFDKATLVEYGLDISKVILIENVADLPRN